MSDQTQMQDISFEAAFAEATGATPPDSQMAPMDQQAQQGEDTQLDSSVPVETNNQVQDEQNQDGSTGEPTENSASAQQTNSSDTQDPYNYKDMFEKARQQRDSLEGRFRQLHEQYTEMKDRIRTMDTAPTSQVQTNQATQQEELPANVKELFELYPEIAGPVQDLISRKLSTVEKQLETLVDNKLAPVQSVLQETTSNTHMAQIRSAHPDLDLILESGDLLDWKNTLPSAARIGAQYIIDHGNAGQVVELLSEYKGARNFTNTNQQQAAPQAQQQGQQPQTPAQQEALVEKLRNSMAVSSNRTNPRTPQINPAPVEDFASAFAEAAKLYS